MINPILRIGAVGLLSVMMVGLPAPVAAQSTNKHATAKSSAATKKEPGETKQKNLPYKGNLVAVDKAAKTLTVSKRTFQVTSDTKLFRGDKPATLADGVVDEYVTLSYKKTDDGKFLAHNVYFGGKDGKGGGQKAQTTAKPEKPQQ